MPRFPQHRQPKMDKPQLTFGRHPVLEALAAGAPVEKIFIQTSAQGDEIRKIFAEAAARDVPVQTVPPEKLNRLVRQNHQGVVAILGLINYYRLEDVLPQIYEKGEIPLFVVLDNITDVRNLGAIARSAACTGAHALVVPAKGSAQVTSEAIKASAGALHSLPVCREKELFQALSFLRLNGIQIVGADANAETMVDKIKWTEPTAIVMGSEGEGISSSARKFLNKTFSIPMAGGFESFNVSVAAGITLYEAMKARLNQR